LQKRIDKTQPTKKEVKEEEEIRGLLKDPRNIDKINVPKVEVDPMLREKLKPYQRDGVKFLWRNCFSDLDSDDKGDDHEIGGCILAHYMGLGKSFTTITALHTALASRSMVKRELDKKQEQERPLLQSVLLIAPANTLTNWVDEVDKWTENLARRLDIMNLGAFAAGSRPRCIKKWKSDGGILLLSDSVFLRVADEITRTGHPDVFVLDEAHTMLTQSSNKGFRKLLNIQTKRKILLTGTPFQNNVTEYYRMVDYIRPGLIEVDSEAEFETEYR
jgi:SNF2 family DNA or RNA helicase